MRRMWTWITAMMVVLVVGVGVSRAQPLAEKVPADALIYVGWQGSQKLGAAYEQSNLKGVLESSGLKSQIQALLDEAIAKAGQDDPTKGQNAETFRALGDAALKYPTAFYWGGVDFTDPRKPMPRLALLIQAGGDAKPLGERITKALAANVDKNPMAPQPKAVVINDMLMIGIGDVAAVEVLIGAKAGAKGKSLAAEKEFAAGMKPLQPNAAVVFYGDVEGMLMTWEDAMATQGPKQAQEMIPKVIEALGLRSLKRVSLSGNFAEKNWTTASFIKIDGPRKGIISLLDMKPLSIKTLRALPADATWAHAYSFDLARLVTELRNGAKLIDPNAAAQLDMGLGRVSNMLGLDVERELLAPLGSEFAIYGQPGDPIQGTALVNTLRDEKLATTGLERLSESISGMLALQGKGEAAGGFTTVTTGPVPLHTLTLPKASPTWAVTNGQWIAGLSPEAVNKAVARAGKADAKSLADNADFARLNKLVAVKDPVVVSFWDLPKTAPAAYAHLVQTANQAAEESEQKGLSWPEYQKLQPFIAPAINVAWSDAEGIYMRSIEPFPGSTMLGGDSMLMNQLGVDSPFATMGKARTKARANASLNNLRQIAVALHMSATENKGVMPADLGSLVSNGYIDTQAVKVFLAPSVPVPAEVLKMNKTELAAWVNKNTSYEYLGGGMDVYMTPKPQEVIVAYEKLTLPTTKLRVSVAYLDGHVVTLSRKALEDKLAVKK